MADDTPVVDCWVVKEPGLRLNAPVVNEENKRLISMFDTSMQQMVEDYGVSDESELLAIFERYCIHMRFRALLDKTPIGN